MARFDLNPRVPFPVPVVMLELSFFVVVMVGVSFLARPFGGGGPFSPFMMMVELSFFVVGMVGLGFYMLDVMVPPVFLRGSGWTGLDPRFSVGGLFTRVPRPRFPMDPRHFGDRPRRPRGPFPRLFPGGLPYYGRGFLRHCPLP